MRRIVTISAILAPLLVALWIDVFPVKCSICHQLVFRTDVSSLLFGGHGDVVHQPCFTGWLAGEGGALAATAEAAPQAASADQEPPAQALAGPTVGAAAALPVASPLLESGRRQVADSDEQPG